ncbi:MAG: 5'-methylthioadenosine/adenosylhomocysteine nucleosidase [Helicobacteraceae bacterium]|jgi:adenosylhomocysteine/aminodeoxyfutalosine nucleosidase|nr:5'-methylthioadenosine/adenosylhomocysteine nucleosidase [Helicobacteraceae bacterium]
MTIGIIGAMTEEVEPILARLGGVKSEKIGKNTYHSAEFAGKKVAAAYSRIGKVNAAITATTLIERFGTEKILFSGVAGALNSALKIGDLIYATRLVQHDVDITAFGHKIGFIPETGDFFASDSALNAIAERIAAKRGVRLGRGVIATGDLFVADNAKKDWIKTTFGADAVEMEGASVACVCDSLGVPFFVLRAISDAADMDAGFNFDAFLRSSAEISADFVLDMVKEI